MPVARFDPDNPLPSKNYYDQLAQLLNKLNGDPSIKQDIRMTVLNIGWSNQYFDSIERNTANSQQVPGATSSDLSAEVTSLREMSAMAKNEISSLKNTIEDLEGKLRTANIEGNKWKDKFNSKCHQLETKNLNLQALQLENIGLERKLKNINNQDGTSDLSPQNQSEDELTKLKRQCEEFEDQYLLCQENLKREQQTIKDLESDNDTLTDEKVVLQEELERFKDLSEKLAKELLKKNEKGNSYAIMRQIGVQTEGEESVREDCLNLAHREIEKLKVELDELKKQHEGCGRHKKYGSSTGNGNGAYGQYNNSAREEMNRLEEKMEELTKLMNDKEKKRKELESSNDNYKTQVEILEQQISVSRQSDEDVIGRLKQDRERYRRERNDADEENHRMRIELQSIHKKYGCILTQIDVRAPIDDLRPQIEVLQRGNDELRAQNNPENNAHH